MPNIPEDIVFSLYCLKEFKKYFQNIFLSSLIIDHISWTHCANENNISLNLFVVDSYPLIKYSKYMKNNSRS